MKKLFLLIGITAMLFISCTYKGKKNVAYIKGNVPKETNSLKFEWIKKHSADIKPQANIAQIDSLGNFEIEIPLQNLSTGIMSINDNRYNVVFAPNDQIEIKVEKDTIVYSGKGAAKNNFLYILSKNDKCSRMGIMMAWYREEHELKDFFVMINDYIIARKEEFEKFSKTFTLSEEYADYFEIENNLEFIDLYKQAIIAYSRKNNLPTDSVNVPKEYEKHFSIKSLQSDKNLIYANYLMILNGMIRSNTEKVLSTNTLLNQDSVKLLMIMDSLSGLTREHYLVQSIFYNLSIYDKYDSALVASFDKIKSDENCIAVVNNELEKFNKKQEMIGAHFNNEILQTELRDTANNKNTMADILKKHEGKVIYLDIWSLGCGPCRMAMPFSKNLKMKLKDYPIDFVYVTIDDFSDDLWSEVFKVSLGKENHYRFEKGFDAKLLEDLGIMAVPTYLMIDKDGKLISYKAERPFNNMMQENPELEKKLIELSGKM